MAHNVYGGPPLGSFVGPPPQGSFVGPPPPSNFTGAPPPPPGPAVYGGAPPPPPANFGLAPPPPGNFGAPGPPGALNAPSPAPFAGPIPPGGPPGGALNGPPPRGRKRLIVTCDGTWLDSDNGLVNGKLAVPSNVVRIAWAIKPLSSDGVQQIVYYQAGIASTGGWIERTVGGATGIGLSEHVQAAYNFLAVNYIRGDEIILMGFSRGAFTARSVAGLIDGVGLLTRKGLPNLSEIYQDYQQRHNPNYRPQYPDNPFPNKPSAKKPAYRQELQRLGLTILDVRIKAIGVWETVGSLGIPRIPIFTGLGLQSRKMKEYSFYDTSLGMGVENAFQALALDEHRAPFAPALWEKRSGSNTNLKQVWFPGVHTNVGGGYADMELANITLAWMISRLEPFLDFNNDFILEQFEINRRYYKAEHEQPRPWSWGKIYNSLTGLYVFAGTKTRTPGAYCRIDPRNGRATNKHLKSTNEYIHPSVRTRIGTGGQGVEDRGKYESKALLNWEFTFPGADEISPTDQAIHQPRVTWRKKDGKDEEGQTEMPESILMDTELQLLETNKKIEEYVMGLPKLRQPKGKRRSKRYD